MTDPRTEAGHLTGTTTVEFLGRIAQERREAVTAALERLRAVVEELVDDAKNARAHNDPEEDVYAIGIEHAVFCIQEAIEEKRNA